MTKKSERRQARTTIISALRIIRDIQVMHRIQTSEVVFAQASIYRHQGNYSASKHLNYAARLIQQDERL